MNTLIAQQTPQLAERTAIGFYLVYAAIAVALVVYLARTLRRNGAIFLVDVFDDDNLAGAVNHLLVIGFYLLNLGYAFLLFQLQPSYGSMTLAFNELTVKVGVLLFSLGVIHLVNMFIFWRIRTHQERKFSAANAPRPVFNPPPPRPQAKPDAGLFGPGTAGAPGAVPRPT